MHRHKRALSVAKPADSSLSLGCFFYYSNLPALISVGSGTWPGLRISSTGAKLCNKSLESLAQATVYYGCMLEARPCLCWSIAAGLSLNMFYSTLTDCGVRKWQRHS